MASIIPGYEYDIFISYRQKDNKGDRWVSEFVDTLKTELESTFKEEISVYFDINPHDGLLETHDVNASLKEKLKCLVFIPIISRTYCDPKSFAWEHEFKAFVEQASQDQFGLKVKLTGGNVANRILPIQIHDLTAEDKTLLEKELGGVLRSIEFIYKEPGVDKPLAPEDNEKKNLNNTKYRIQIIKVAHAIKDIVLGLKTEHDPLVKGTPPLKELLNKEKKEDSRKEVISKGIIDQKSKKWLIMLLTMFICVAGAYAIYKILDRRKQTQDLTNLEKTIAVLPFRNLSNDTTQLYFCDGFMAEILNDLQKVKSFTVRSRTSSDQYRDTKKSSTSISNELKVNYLVEGSIGRERNNLKIQVSLIDAKADKQMWSNDYPREMNQPFAVQSEIAKDIATELKAILSPEEIKKIEKKPTENPEAYNYYLQGNYYLWRGSGSGDDRTAIELYEKAIGLDPGFALAYSGKARCLLDQYWSYYDHTEDIKSKSKQAIDKAFEIDPDLPDAHLALGLYYYWGYLKYPQALKQFELVLKDQPKSPEVINYSAAVHRRAGNWEMAKSEYEKAVELNPGRSDVAFNAGETFDLLRNYSKAEEYYNMSILLQPDLGLSYVDLSRMYLRWEGDTRKAREVLGNAARNNKAYISDSLIIETNFLIDIYDGKYEEALKDISLLKNDVVQDQGYFRPKYLYNATIYGLMNRHELEHAYYDSARFFLERRIVNIPDDPRLVSSLGIVYAGLGLDEKAISEGEKAIKLLPVSKDAYSGVYLVEDLTLIYVMVGNYDEAIKQIKYLLSIPGFLSTKILELDPRWAPLRNLPEFKKMMESYSVK
jgi:TolB-like protein/Flp pilus assembly protein TadD